MCGTAGILDVSDKTNASARALAAVPLASGHRVAPDAGLSILSERGAQPMWSHGA